MLLLVNTNWPTYRATIDTALKPTFEAAFKATIHTTVETAI
jgi:hypothetical protein